MKAGSIVECVAAIYPNPGAEHYPNTLPKKGNYYTVREVAFGVGIRLEEIINPPCKYREGFAECAFMINAFREIEFPPSLEEEIKESLTRELVYENS